MDFKINGYGISISEIIVYCKMTQAAIIQFQVSGGGIIKDFMIRIIAIWMKDIFSHVFHGRLTRIIISLNKIRLAIS